MTQVRPSWSLEQEPAPPCSAERMLCDSVRQLLSTEIHLAAPVEPYLINVQSTEISPLGRRSRWRAKQEIALLVWRLRWVQDAPRSSGGKGSTEERVRKRRSIPGRLCHLCPCREHCEIQDQNSTTAQARRKWTVNAAKGVRNMVAESLVE